MTTRGIRGATTVLTNEASLILEYTQELLTSIQVANETLKPEDIASVLFTMTTDLDATYPAKAARQLGWINVPLMCAQEIPVPDGLPLCIRILITWNTNLPQNAIRHVYLRDAVTLRPDLDTQIKRGQQC